MRVLARASLERVLDVPLLLLRGAPRDGTRILISNDVLVHQLADALEVVLTDFFDER